MDSVEVYFEPCEGDRLVLEQVIESQVCIILVRIILMPEGICYMCGWFIRVDCF
jgi:hypothetical protein